MADDKPKRISRNVYLTLLMCAIWGLADSIWNGTILAAWLYLLSDDKNAPVGYVEAASGLAALIFALPLGYLADKIGRSPVIKFAGLLFLLATVSTAYSVLYQPVNDFTWLTCSMILWGIGGAIFNGPSQALFADSVPTGERSKWYSRLFSSYLIPGIVGPIISIILFHVYGNNWTFEEMKPIFLTGLACELPCAFLACFFSDKDVVADDEQTNDEEKEEDGEKNNKNDEDDKDDDKKVKGFCGCTRKVIPYVMFASSLLTAFGSGMTIKFFPLFFKNQLMMAPANVQAIYVAVPIAMTLCVQLSQIVGSKIGRIQTMLLVRIIGVSLLVSMSVLVNKGITIWYYCVPIYIVRTAIMNSTYPLEESTIMDFVPKDTRSRWKSLDSIAAFGWCGSAAIGGILADKYSYSFTFYITAILQGLGGAVLILLLPLVPINENFKNDDNNTTIASDDNNNNSINSGGDYVFLKGSKSPSLNNNNKSPRSPRMNVYERSSRRNNERKLNQISRGRKSGSFDDSHYEPLIGGDSV